MKKFALVLVLFCATQMHAGVFKHVLKPVGKAVASAGEAVADGTVTAGEAIGKGTATGAKASGKAVKNVLI